MDIQSVLNEVLARLAAIENKVDQIVAQNAKQLPPQGAEADDDCMPDIIPFDNDDQPDEELGEDVAAAEDGDRPQLLPSPVGHPEAETSRAAAARARDMSHRKRQQPENVAAVDVSEDNEDLDFPDTGGLSFAVYNLPFRKPTAYRRGNHCPWQLASVEDYQSHPHQDKQQREQWPEKIIITDIECCDTNHPDLIAELLREREHRGFLREQQQMMKGQLYRRDLLSPPEDKPNLDAFNMTQGLVSEAPEAADQQVYLDDIELPPWDPSEAAQEAADEDDGDGIDDEDSKGEHDIGVNPDDQQEEEQVDEAEAEQQQLLWEEEIKDLLQQLVDRMCLDNETARSNALMELTDYVQGVLEVSRPSRIHYLRALNRVTVVLGSMKDALDMLVKRWESKELPNLENSAYDYWQAGRNSACRKGWLGDIASLQSRFFKVLLELQKTHIQPSDPAPPSYSSVLRLTRGALELTVFELSSLLWKLGLGSEGSQPPPAPAAADPAHNVQRRQHEKGTTAASTAAVVPGGGSNVVIRTRAEEDDGISLGSDEEDDDDEDDQDDEFDDFIDDGPEAAASQDKEGDHLETEAVGTGNNPWNAAGLAPNQTEILTTYNSTRHKNLQTAATANNITERSALAPPEAMEIDTTGGVSEDLAPTENADQHQDQTGGSGFDDASGAETSPPSPGAIGQEEDIVIEVSEDAETESLEDGDDGGTAQQESLEEGEIGEEEEEEEEEEGDGEDEWAWREQKHLDWLCSLPANTPLEVLKHRPELGPHWVPCTLIKLVRRNTTTASTKPIEPTIRASETRAKVTYVDENGSAVSDICQPELLRPPVPLSSDSKVDCRFNPAHCFPGDLCEVNLLHDLKLNGGSNANRRYQWVTGVLVRVMKTPITPNILPRQLQQQQQEIEMEMKEGRGGKQGANKISKTSRRSVSDVLQYMNAVQDLNPEYSQASCTASVWIQSFGSKHLIEIPCNQEQDIEDQGQGDLDTVPPHDQHQRQHHRHVRHVSWWNGEKWFSMGDSPSVAAYSVAKYWQLYCQRFPDGLKITPVSKLRTLFNAPSTILDKLVCSSLKKMHEPQGSVTEALRQLFVKKYLTRYPHTEFERCKNFLGMKPVKATNKTRGPRDREGNRLTGDMWILSRRRGSGPSGPQQPIVRCLSKTTWKPAFTKQNKKKNQSGPSQDQIINGPAATPSTIGLSSPSSTQKKKVQADLGKLFAKENEKVARRQAKFDSKLADASQLSHGHDHAGPSAAAHEKIEDLNALELFHGEPELLKLCAVKVPGCIAAELKGHQWQGVRHLWKSLVIDNELDEEDKGGCVLAHHMGLGKTLQTITFLCCYQAASPDHRAAVVVPVNVLENWWDEFNKWLPSANTSSNSLTIKKVVIGRTYEDVLSWHRKRGGVLIITHETFRSFILDNPRKNRRKATSDSSSKVSEMLTNDIDVLVMDEGHVLKSKNTLINQAMNKVATYRRVVLTGYPLQNNLDEYYWMVSWVDDILGSRSEFEEEFSKPIQAGQMPNATLLERRTMQRKLSVLHDLTSRVVHRLDDSMLRDELPTKREHVVRLALSPLQQAVYAAYLEGLDKKTLFKNKEKLTDLCDRPSQFKKYLEDLVKAGDAAAAVGSGELGAAAGALANNSNNAPHTAGNGTDGPSSLLSKPQAGAAVAMEVDDGGGAGGGAGFELDGTEEDDDEDTELEEEEEVAAVEGEEDAGPSRRLEPEIEGMNAAAGPSIAGRGSNGPQKKAVQGKDLPVTLARNLLDIIYNAEARGESFDTLSTSKMWAVKMLIRFCLENNEPLLIVSERVNTLCAVQSLIEQESAKHTKPLTFRVLTGMTSAKDRQKYVKEIEKGKVQFLLMSKAGTHGINLVCVRRMVLLDEPWNPVYNAQSVARIFRYRQTAETFVYRLQYGGTMEHNVYLKNVNKVELFKRVVDKQEVKRVGLHSEGRLSVYHFSPETPPPADQPLDESTATAKSQDPAIAALLTVDMEQPSARCIVGVSDHDANLAKDPTSALTKQERSTASFEYFYNLKHNAKSKPGTGTTGAAAATAGGGGGDGASDGAGGAQKQGEGYQIQTRRARRLMMMYANENFAKMAAEKEAEARKQAEAEAQARAQLEAEVAEARRLHSLEQRATAAAAAVAEATRRPTIVPQATSASHRPQQQQQQLQPQPRPQNAYHAPIITSIPLNARSSSAARPAMVPGLGRPMSVPQMPPSRPQTLNPEHQASLYNNAAAAAMAVAAAAAARSRPAPQQLVPPSAALYQQLMQQASLAATLSAAQQKRQVSAAAGAQQAQQRQTILGKRSAEEAELPQKQQQQAAVARIVTNGNNKNAQSDDEATISLNEADQQQQQENGEANGFEEATSPAGKRSRRYSNKITKPTNAPSSVAPAATPVSDADDADGGAAQQPNGKMAVAAPTQVQQQQQQQQQHREQTSFDVILAIPEIIIPASHPQPSVPLTTTQPQRQQQQQQQQQATDARGASGSAGKNKVATMCPTADKKALQSKVLNVASKAKDVVAASTHMTGVIDNGNIDRDGGGGGGSNGRTTERDASGSSIMIDGHTGDGTGGSGSKVNEEDNIVFNNSHGGNVEQEQDRPVDRGECEVIDLTFDD